MPVFIYKYLALIAGCIILFIAGYSYGNIQGYTKGLVKQQVTIDALTETINLDRASTLAKVTSLIQDSANKEAKINVVQKQALATKTQIITKYQTEYVAAKCGLSTETVAAVNSLLAVDNVAFTMFTGNKP